MNPKFINILGPIILLAIVLAELAAYAVERLTHARS